MCITHCNASFYKEWALFLLWLVLHISRRPSSSGFKTLLMRINIFSTTKIGDGSAWDVDLRRSIRHTVCRVRVDYAIILQQTPACFIQSLINIAAIGRRQHSREIELNIKRKLLCTVAGYYKRFSVRSGWFLYYYTFDHDGKHCAIILAQIGTFQRLNKQVHCVCEYYIIALLNCRIICISRAYVYIQLSSNLAITWAAILSLHWHDWWDGYWCVYSVYTCD